MQPQDHHASVVTTESSSPSPEQIDAFGFDATYYDRGMRIAGAYFKWLRVQVDGLDNVPMTGPALLVGNHAGLRCHDSLALQFAIRHHHPAGRVIRPLMDHTITKAPVWGMAATEYAGGVVAHPRNADYLLERGYLVLVYPEGRHSISKRFRDRNRLCPPEQWGSGFVLTAIRNGVPIIPFVTHGFEAALPILWRSRVLGRVWGTRHGRFPVFPQAFVTATIPLFTVALPFPVRCKISILPPVEPGDVASSYQSAPEDTFRPVALRIRDLINQRLKELVART